LREEVAHARCEVIGPEETDGASIVLMQASAVVKGTCSRSAMIEPVSVAFGSRLATTLLGA